MKTGTTVLHMLFAGFAGLALLTTALPAQATSFSYGIVSTLNGAQQVPPNNSMATGAAKASYDKSTNQLAVTITVAGVTTSQLAASHIHLGAAGTSGGILVDLGTAGWANTASGMTLSTAVSIPEANEIDLHDGNTYFNLHTTTYTGGEIRGQIVVSATLVGISYAYPYATSADGNVVVGERANNNGIEAFRWTPMDDVQALGLPPNAAVTCNDDVCSHSSRATAVSADGTVIASYVLTTQGTSNALEAFRWTAADGLVSLGSYLSLYPFGNPARGISDDGSSIVGSGLTSSDDGYRWTAATGLVQLPNLPSVDGGVAYGIAGNGSITVGSSGLDAVKWPASGGIAKLGLLPGAYHGRAHAASSDGSLVVGCSDTGYVTPDRAVRWAGTDSPVLLEALAEEYSSCATGVSADGKTIVGGAGLNPSFGLGYTAFIWTAQTGKRKLADILAERGVDITGWTFTDAYGISRDASTIVGHGYVNGVSMGFVVYLKPAVALPTPAASADLALSMTDSPDPVKKLARLTYNIGVKNNGPDVTTGVVLTDVLPANVSFISAMPSQGSCSGTTTVTCSLGSMASGASVSVSIVVRTKTVGILSNSASVTSAVVDPSTANNSASTNTKVK